MIAIEQSGDGVAVELRGIDCDAGRIWGQVVNVNGEAVLGIECGVTPEEYGGWSAAADYPALMLLQKNGLTAKANAV